MPQCSHEGRGLPVSPRSVSHQSLASKRATIKPHQVGAKAAFIDEYQSSHVEAQPQDLPEQPLLMNIGTLLLCRMQDFFLKVSLRRTSARAMVASPTFSPN